MEEGKLAEAEDTRRGDDGEEQETSRIDFYHISTARVDLVAKPSIPIWADNGQRPLPSSPSGEQCAPYPLLVRLPSQMGDDCLDSLRKHAEIKES